MKGRPSAAIVLLALSLSCGIAPSSSDSPAQAPTAEEVRSFLSQVSSAAASGKASDLDRFFEKGSSYPKEDFAMIRGSEFWKLQPSRKIKRLGADAFQIRLLPQKAEPTAGFVEVRTYLDLPVRRDREGHLRILSRKETERLQKLPVPETPGGEAVVDLDYPDEGDSARKGGRHFATEFWAEASTDMALLHIRFDPPMTGARLRADLPIGETFHFGEEIRVELSLDADASASTGFRMDRFYERLKEVEKGFETGHEQRRREWEGFGTDKKLNVEGKKFVTEDGGRAWGLRASLRDVALEIVQPGTWVDRGEKVFERTQADPEMRVEGDVLTVTVPIGILPMRPGGLYRVMLEHNGGYALRLKAAKGRVAAR